MNVDTIVVTNLLCWHQFPTPRFQILKRGRVIPRPPLKQRTRFMEDETSTRQTLNFILEGQTLPVFIADPIGNDYVWQLSHDSLGSRVHEIESTAIIGLLEGVFIGESEHLSAFELKAAFETNLWKPRPSMRTTIQVFGSRGSGCSKAFTYSYLGFVSLR